MLLDTVDRDLEGRLGWAGCAGRKIGVWENHLGLIAGPACAFEHARIAGLTGAVVAVNHRQSSSQQQALVRGNRVDMTQVLQCQ